MPRVNHRDVLLDPRWCGAASASEPRGALEQASYGKLALACDVVCATCRDYGVAHLVAGPTHPSCRGLTRRSSFRRRENYWQGDE